MINKISGRILHNLRNFCWFSLHRSFLKRRSDHRFSVKNSQNFEKNSPELHEIPIFWSKWRQYLLNSRKCCRNFVEKSRLEPDILRQRLELALSRLFRLPAPWSKPCSCAGCDFPWRCGCRRLHSSSFAVCAASGYVSAAGVLSSL